MVRRCEGEKVGKWGDNIKVGMGNVEGGKQREKGWNA
jgi:hypothetical protein